MNITDTIKTILRDSKSPLKPQELREIIKQDFPHYYGTEFHMLNVRKGHYKDIDHALLAQIYSIVKSNKDIYCDRSHKPMLVSLLGKKIVTKITPKKVVVSKNVVNNEDELISNLPFYYRKSLNVLNDFGGPSIYFHVQAIKEQENYFLSTRHIELIYATLVSWGMHKMGDPNITKTKMVDFELFKSSIYRFAEQFQSLKRFQLSSCTENEYVEFLNGIENIYYNLQVSISDSTIVANSKTLAHILPNSIPPIDRQYTIRFFTQDKNDFFTKSGSYKLVNTPRDISSQFKAFKEYCIRIKRIYDNSQNDIFLINKESFNSSYPKIIDNLIMAFVKSVPKPL